MLNAESECVDVKRIFFNEHYCITKHSIPSSVEGSDLVVVCFASVHGGLKEKGFGVEFLLKNGINCFYVSHRPGSYYQGLSGDQLKFHLSPYLKGEKVYTYGSSLGGYAAIYYSKYLGGKALAFSPRCSADPLYQNKFTEIAFKHEKLSDCNQVEFENPIIVYDPNEPMDKSFYDERLYPLFGDTGEYIELPNATHNAIEAILNQGTLKHFVINYFKHDRLVDIEYDPDNNSFVLSDVAMKYCRNKDWEQANYCLKKIFTINQPRVRGVKRLEAYRELVRNKKLNHTFNKKRILESERKHAFLKFYKSSAGKNHREFILNEFRLYILLMDYGLARQVAKHAAFAYPKLEKQHKLVATADNFISNSSGWVF